MIELPDASVAVIALLILHVVIRDVVGPLVKKRNGDSPSDRQAMIQDMHGWMAPDTKGRQNWKGAAIEEAMNRLGVETKAQTEELHKLNINIERMLMGK